MCQGVMAASHYRVVLGKEIRAQRRRAGLTQERLAKKADLHPNYLGRVERGEECVSIASLRGIARALNVRVRDLVVGI
jgi:transcriptional regulator with XRE-family HTH domain